MIKNELIIKKMSDSKKVVKEAFEKYSSQDIALAWTGGKDSTLLLEIIHQVCEEHIHSPFFIYVYFQKHLLFNFYVYILLYSILFTLRKVQCACCLL
jgi:3'-phosphoadenosine 5'-phosphosulfate sulfotransferase (PAPS reductase)/FAD synthetase